MNMISNVLKKLPSLKSSADFDAAIIDLETEGLPRHLRISPPSRPDIRPGKPPGQTDRQL